MRHLTAVAALVCAGVAWGDATAPGKFELENGALKLPSTIYFKTNSDEIKQPESEPALAHAKAYLDAKPEVTLLRIEVHSDAQGADSYNQAMSEKRALSVARALVARGIDCQRLIAVGFGETKPIADNRTAEGRAQNRRTVLVNAALRGRPIGGLPVDGGGKVGGPTCPPPVPPT